MTRSASLLILGAVLACAGCSTRPSSVPFHMPLDRIVDMTYGLGPETVYWPTAKKFEMETVSYGKTEAGFFYAANNLCMAEHGGTHMDAPIHFAEGRITADQVPLAAGIGPAVVVDVRKKADKDRDYRLQVEDLKNWESDHGRIPDGAIVILFSGWGERWPDAKRYLGTAKRGDVGNLHFPGFSAKAARFLVEERNIAAVAVDTASIDHGPSDEFPVHRIINGANKPGFENLANVDRLPPAGATLIALPLKVEGGSGAPARIIAVLPE